MFNLVTRARFTAHHTQARLRRSLLAAALLFSASSSAESTLSVEGALSSQETSNLSQNVAHSSLKLSLGDLDYRFEGAQGLIIRDLFSGGG